MISGQGVVEKSRVMDFGYCNLQEIVCLDGGESAPFINWSDSHSDDYYSTIDNMGSLLILYDPTLAGSKKEAAMRRLQCPLTAGNTKVFIKKVGRHEISNLVASAQNLGASSFESSFRPHQQHFFYVIKKTRDLTDVTSMKHISQTGAPLLGQTDCAMTQAFWY